MAYRWVQREEQVGSTRLSLECIDDFEAEVAAFCDRMLSEGRSYAEFEDLCPMFGALWPVARALAWRVDEVGSGLAGRRVLELGCGLGLPSLVAARHGALVVATDQHPDAGPLLGRTAATNGVAGLRYVSFDWRGRAPAEVRNFISG